MNRLLAVFPGLLMREWHEHRGAFTWGPGIVLALVVLIGFVMTAFEGRFEMEISEVERNEVRERLEIRDDAGVMESVAALALDAAGSTDAELTRKLDNLLNAISIPFYLVLMIISIIAFIACVHDERKDQSILFWKSMPVGDTASILSKYAFVAWVAPLVTFVAITIAHVFAITVVSIAVEDGMGGRIWSNSGLLVRPIQLLVGFLLNGVWMLPVFAWIMCVSSVATKVPFLWVIAVPWVLGLLERIFLGTTHFADAITAHAASGTLPVPVEGGIYTFGRMFSVVGQPEMWVGLLIGVGLIYLTIYFRGRFNVI